MEKTVSNSAAVRNFLRPQRYFVSATVDIALGGRRAGMGTLINISSGGVAFSSYTQLNVGSEYLITVRGVGSYPFTMVRRFGCHGYGGRLVLDPKQARDLGRLLSDIGTPLDDD